MPNRQPRSVDFLKQRAKSMCNIGTGKRASMDEIAIELPGSMGRVVRIGHTVHRRVHRNTPAVHALLRHFEEIGFNGAPKVLGFDEQGREILGYVRGIAGHYPLTPYVLSESTLIGLALLLRRFHDATARSSIPQTVVWHHAIPGPREVICHGDAGPYNIIFRNRVPVALIDFDRAAPGPRIWDIAFVVYRFAPLCDLQERMFTATFLQQIAGRIRTFLGAYGFCGAHELFDWIQLRLKTEIDWLCAENGEDDARRRKFVEDGHAEFYKRDLRAISGVATTLQGLI